VYLYRWYSGNWHGQLARAESASADIPLRPVGKRIWDWPFPFRSRAARTPCRVPSPAWLQLSRKSAVPRRSFRATSLDTLAFEPVSASASATEIAIWTAPSSASDLLERQRERDHFERWMVAASPVWCGSCLDWASGDDGSGNHHCHVAHFLQRQLFECTSSHGESSPMP
jgi:hypothetical protein